MSRGDVNRESGRGRRRATRLLKLAGGLVLAGVTLAACSTSTSQSSSGGTPINGGTATFAELPAATPNWIFPFMGLAHFGVQNTAQFQYLMYRPLYWFGNGDQPTLNPSLSLADLPVYSNNGQTVTITLKNYKWSNGETVTAQDIEFWMNLLEAEKTKWAAYVPGAFPDNVTSYSVESPTKFVMHLNKSYSTNWFTYNELSQITPLPMAWDVTASGPSSCATSVSACAGVYAYLHKLSSQESTYTSSPIWAVVDGPWKLSAFSTSGQVTLVPNPDYSGPVKPHLAAFEELPFTSASSEFSNLKAGNTLDVGFLPLADSAQETAIAALGYQLSPWISWSINYFPLNFNNPKVGAIFKQLYVRQAFQELVDQPLYIKQAMAGKGAPTYGPVPVAPKTADASPSESSNPYPYNPSRAKALLTSHGWRLNSSGVLQCSDPGSGSNQCGPGVAGGATMDFNLQYASGLNHLTTIMEAMKSGFSQVGIVLNLSTAPFDTVIGTAIPCTPSQSTCSWEMENWGGGWSYAPDYYPTGGEIFGTGAGSNSGSYSDPETDSLIAATHTDSSLSSLYKYENYLAEQLPVVWQPNPPYYLTEIKDNLHGVTPQNPVLALTPENWYFTKS